MGLQAKTIPDDGVVSLEGLMKEGADLQTSLAAGKLLLFKDTLTTLTGLTAAILAAQEADFDGYTAGGVAVATVNDPYEDTNGSVLVTAPLKQFNFVSAAPTVNTNSIGGAAYVDAAGVVRGAFLFDAPVSMALNTDSIPVVMTWRIGAVPEAP